MASYADAELLISRWLSDRLGRKVHADPQLPANWWSMAPVALLQRGPGEGDTQLTLDTAVLDVDWYGKNADHVREWAEKTRGEMRFHLPKHTFDDGIFVTGTQTVTPPTWAPEFERGVYRRTAAYRVFLHGIIS